MRHLDNHEGQGLEDESVNGESFTQLWLWNEAFKKKKSLRRAYRCLLPWIPLLHLRASKPGEPERVHVPLR